MNLTPEQKAIGRRNFLRALAGTPALATLGAASVIKGPLRGGPVRLGYIGVGGQGRVLVDRADPAHAEVRALCDINPTQLKRADGILTKRGRPSARHYVEWRDMLEHEDLEAVVIGLPLWLHADVVVGCLEAGKHVLCEKMMAWDVAGCERMMQAAARNRRVLEIGYQRNYNPVYRAAYEGIVQRGLLGDIYHARMVWHRNANWRRKGEPPSPDYDPSRWGYPTFEHLLNWRLYWRYSKGLWAELASHQVNAVNWFLGATPEAVCATGGVYRFKDGREVHDHVYGTFEYPQGRTVTFSSIESNAFERNYESFMGTKGTLILTTERDAYLFEEGASGSPTGIQVSPKDASAAVDASETRPPAPTGAALSVAASSAERPSATNLQISAFCAAVRVGTPIACGPERAFHSPRACIRAHEAVEQKARLVVEPKGRLVTS